MSATDGSPPYRGRFAPSPTGPLHRGSLVAALASFLDARHHGGQWLLRIEDIDPPREMAGAAQSILDTLRCHGLCWDGEPLWQSSRLTAYRDAVTLLKQRADLFDCVCTRAVLGPAGSCGRRCRPRPGQASALRIALPARLPGYEDLLCGPQPGEDQPGDVVLWRKDGLPAYTLAVTVDDGWQGISHVLRGADLQSQTVLQRHILALLDYPLPVYGHLPLVYASDGRKLSKQNGAAALDNSCAIANLRAALRVLGQESAEHDAATADALLATAITHWKRSTVAVA
jgi:glutamyl-Q tRNA(Asp) synthetase